MKHKTYRIKKLTALLLSCILIITAVPLLSGCSTPVRTSPAADNIGFQNDVSGIEIAAGELEGSDAEPGSWAIYWYLCGSDLETEYACATGDLLELLEVNLPDNVNIVIQTGGAEVWQNDAMDASKTQRWLYDSDGLFLVDEQPLANMGEAQTLYDFLAFAEASYPAEKTAVIFWNHGGGSVTGASFDENYEFDSLDLLEMYAAFDTLWPADKENPVLELVGFDACLMATIDVAATFQPFAKYLAASEEVEPGNGWLYSQWVKDLAENPSMDGEELGISICNAYYKGCEKVRTAGQATLSLTDLTKLDDLLLAYETFGEEAFLAASKDPSFFAELGRAASLSENYGGNTQDQGYTNMVDLGHFARQTAWMLPSAQGVLDALRGCIAYQVTGPYRREATGLSCYYNYNGDIHNLNGYLNVGTGQAFKHLYTYGLTGKISEEGREYLEELNLTASFMPAVPTLENMEWNGAPVEINDDGNAVMNLGDDAYAVLAGVGYTLYYVDEEFDQILILGSDNDMTADWESGVFTDNFRGVWGAIDGCMVYMELICDGDGYNLYSVPVLLNEQLYYLRVVYDFNTEEWTILGAAKALDDTGMASKELRLLEEGDKITTIWKMASFSGEDDFEMYRVDDLTVTADTEFCEVELFDGHYALTFEMWDSAGNFAYSDLVDIEIEDGEMWTSVYED